MSKQDKIFAASVPCAPFSPDGDEKNKALEKFKTKLDTFIKNIEKILEDNGGQWMVGNDFTWADLYVAYVLNQVSLNRLCYKELCLLIPNCSTSEDLLALSGRARLPSCSPTRQRSSIFRRSRLTSTKGHTPSINCQIESNEKFCSCQDTSFSAS